MKDITLPAARVNLGRWWFLKHAGWRSLAFLALVMYGDILLLSLPMTLSDNSSLPLACLGKGAIVVGVGCALCAFVMVTFACWQACRPGVPMRAVGEKIPDTFALLLCVLAAEVAFVPTFLALVAPWFVRVLVGIAAVAVGLPKFADARKQAKLRPRPVNA